MRGKREMLSSKYSSIAMITGSLLVTACGGGGGGNTNTNDTSTPESNNPIQNQNLAGSLAIPEPIETTMSNISVASNGRIFMAQETDCPNIPMGYDPLTNANITLLNQAGNSLGITTITDECGMFSLSAPMTASSVSATATGVRDITVPVTQFSANSQTGGLASTIPDTSDYEIGSLSLLDNDTIAFTIVDSATGTAVIGAPPSAFSALLNGTPINISTSPNASGASAEATSVGLVMDASTSMSFTVVDPNDPNNPDPFTQYELAALSAHQFLDQKSASDEVLVTVFDNQINVIDDMSISNLFDINDANGMPTTYAFSTDGFTVNSSDLRFIIDAYTPSSQLYGDPTGVPLHPDTPDFSISSFYPFGGLTAFYSATNDALQRIAPRSNTRQILIAMTDGGDNASLIDESQLISAANAENIPVFTIGFGQFSDNDSLQRIADSTGGDFFLAEGADITAAFQSIGTNVQFFYTADLAQNLVAPFDFALNLSFNGQNISRSLIQN